jgi:site-specific recombinase XerD
MIVKWFELFVQEKQYLNNLSPHTIRSYKRAFKTFQKMKGELSKETPALEPVQILCL